MIERRRRERVILISEPPRHGKSEHVSHWLPVWHNFRFPNDYIGVASYASSFAKDWGELARNTFDEHAHLFGMRLDRRRSAKDHWGAVGYRGGMRTGGMRSGWSGKGLRTFVLDDLLKDDEEALSENHCEKQWNWFKSTARSRLTPDGVIIVMATRWTQQDITGRILAGDLGADWPYVHVCLPAIAEENDQLGRRPGEALWPERWPVEILKTYREGDGSDDFWWQALYQQRPTQHLFAEWPESYFNDIDAGEWPAFFELSVIAVDAAKGGDTGDYGAIVFAGLYQGKIYVTADIRRRPVPELIADTAEMATRLMPEEVAFESNGFQELLAGDFEDYQNEHGGFPYVVERLQNYGVEKRTRIRRLGGYLKSRRIRFDRGVPGVELLIKQLKAFPEGDYDDGPDALEMAIRRLNMLASEQMAYEPDAAYD